MQAMRRRSWLGALGVVLVATISAAGCTGDPGHGGKAGGGDEPVVLTMADGYASIDYVPGAAYFVERVGQLSGGALRIDVTDLWGGDGAPDFEQRIVRDVAAGKADLGWVGTRVFDTLGLKSFQALTAPMLIDSYPLERAVIASGIPAQMLRSLRRLHVAGLAVLGDGLRKPTGTQRPLLGQADWSGIVFATIRSEGQFTAIEALGARPTEIWSAPLTQAFDAGSVQGREMDLGRYEISDYEWWTPYVTANVDLWPHTLALLANQQRLSELNAEQRGWLQRAAQEAAARSTSLADRDAQFAPIACRDGARLSNASETDLAWLRHAFAPVYAQLEQDPQTKGFIDTIEGLKRSTPTGPALAIPAGCTGPRGGQAAPNDRLTGTWQTDRLTESQVVRAFVAAGGSEKDGRAFFSQLGVSAATVPTTGSTHRYAVITLQFKDGFLYRESESGDGGPAVNGSQGTYGIASDGTLTISERACMGSYRVDVTGETMRLQVVKQCIDPDAPYNTALLTSSPFHVAAEPPVDG